MFGQVVMLLLGGFAIAAALSKHFIAKQLAVAILARAGRRPRDVLLANMLVAAFASMWISNVAAPVLCFSLVQPILRTLPPSHPFARALVIGIALASNLGGMTSPIASPQNIFAVERMSMGGAPPSWLAWFAVALPVALAGNLVCWVLILLVYRPGAKIREVRPLRPPEDPLSATQVYVIVVSIGTVALWCCNNLMSHVTGEMGVLAILPLGAFCGGGKGGVGGSWGCFACLFVAVCACGLPPTHPFLNTHTHALNKQQHTTSKTTVAFFGFGVLSKDDFNGFLWNVVMLAMGGLALGEAVKSSGLLLTIATVRGFGHFLGASRGCTDGPRDLTNTMQHHTTNNKTNTTINNHHHQSIKHRASRASSTASTCGPSAPSSARSSWSPPRSSRTPSARWSSSPSCSRSGSRWRRPAAAAATARRTTGCS
jgi:di/tricarboxylate transporter